MNEINLHEPVNEALKLPGGAFFYRCALQVNPFDYIIMVKEVLDGGRAAFETRRIKYGF